ncbi:hypothetical protein IF128_07655 [Empedobacter stercoris]|uniref:hypothetical protein n=1 Tax=Empedobacter stercoris TaxID=1628248 RepID=UPI0016623597|nr:hypothetical protein [Empedobacter stercoris]MCA4809615.1 hypothetical protein [Empedobacter stercoris]QNT13538.1 hypothetical protein HNV03_01955 [Empedobacter stercoris]
MSTNKITETKKSKLEIHYYFSDGSHSIDAEIYLSNLKNVLEIIKTVSNTFKIIHKVEIEPAKEGGFETYITIIEESVKAYPYLTATLTGCVSLILANPTKKIFENLLKPKIEKENELIDSAIKKLDLEEKTIDVENKKLDLEKRKEDLLNNSKKIEEKSNSLQENLKIVTSRSNFYKEANKIEKVKKIGFNNLTENEAEENEQIVKRELFKNYIIDTPELEPLIDNKAEIEIISPVLDKNKPYKWKGKLNGKDITINMKSNIFKTEVQSGSIKFKKGSKLICNLEIKRKYDANGDIVVTSYDLLNVWKYISGKKEVIIESI